MYYNIHTNARYIKVSLQPRSHPVQSRLRQRAIVSCAALVASQSQSGAASFARRLKEKGKPHKLVLIAVARKLIIIANALLAKNVMWKQA